MRLINKEKLESEMYHNAFEINTDLQKWDSGCWIRYKMFENVIEEQPEVKAIPIDWILHQAIETDEQGSFTTAYLMLTEKWRNENETN